MKKTKVFKKLIISVLALSMVLGSFCMTFAEEQSNKPADELKAELMVSETGYESIAGMYEDTVLAKKDGKWGMVKSDQTVLVPFEYDSVSGMDKDIFLARKGDKWGMVKSDQTVLVPFEYDGVSSHDTKDGVVVFKKSSGKYDGWRDVYDYCAFDKNGNFLYKADALMDDGYSYTSDLTYFNGLYLHQINSVVGTYIRSVYIDSKTNTILELWETQDPFDESGKYGYSVTSLSGKGYSVAYPSYMNNNQNAPAYLVSKDGFKELNVDLKGTHPLFTDGRVIFCSEDEMPEVINADSQWKRFYYVLNINTNELVKIHELVVDFSYEDDTEYGFCGDMLYLKAKDENGNVTYSLFDTNGKALTEKKYSSIDTGFDVKKYYLASKDDKYFYIDANGKEYGTEFKDVGKFVDGQAIVLNQDGQAYIVDEYFNQISESISAESVLTGNKNAYAVKKADGKYYPVYAKAASDTYAKELTEGKEIISSTGFASILAENATKDVVIKNADNVTFTFDKGTMTAVEGKTEYDFGTIIIRDYDKASNLSSEFNKENFVLQVIYNYSGKLPANASITFNVGSELAGKTLYYYLCNEDKTYTLIQNVVVADNGSVTVKQDHCSTYVLTGSKLISEPETNTDTNDNPANEAPATGDSTNYILFIILLVASLGAMISAGSKIAADRA